MKTESKSMTRAKGLEHVAIAVKDLDVAVTYYVDVLGFAPPELEVAGAWGRETGAAAAAAEWDGAGAAGCVRTGSGRATEGSERGAAS